MDRLAAFLAARGPAAGGFRAEPVPKAIGQISRAERLMLGELVAAGHVVEAPGRSPWGVRAPTHTFSAALHSFGWLDDLAAVGDQRARALAQSWTADWIARYGTGKGPGWTPAIAARRLLRLIHHAQILQRQAPPDAVARLRKTLATHTRFLARRARHAPTPLGRIEAHVATLCAADILVGLEALKPAALRSLAEVAERALLPGGALVTRNPEALLTALTHLGWALEAVPQGDKARQPLTEIAREVAATLRVLRHRDGGLARFHGGGRGAVGELDAALAAGGGRGKPRDGLAMGFARLSAGRTSVIVDAAAPPTGPSSAGAHASTLAFELTTGRRPLIVNCGAGHTFGPDWRRAGRATPSHSTLCLNGASSAVLADPRDDGAEWLSDGPRRVPAEIKRNADALTLEAGHDGYVARFGLTHARTFALSRDGRRIAGEEYLVALDDAAKARFDAVVLKSGQDALPFRVHFHLHADVDAALSRDGRSVNLALRSGEMWVLASQDADRVLLEPSVYLQAGRAHPRPTSQVVLEGHARDHTTRVRWSLANAQATGPVVRDLVEDALEDV